MIKIPMSRTSAPAALGVGLACALSMLIAACGSPPQAGASPGSSAKAAASPSFCSLGPQCPVAGAHSSPTPAHLPAGVLADIPLDPRAAPLGVVAAFESIWVSTHRGTVLYRIDPQSNTVIARIDVGQDSCGPIVVGFGKVWVGHCETGDKEVAVDPATNQVVGSFTGGVSTAAFGAIWSVSNGFDAVERVDPTSYRVTATVKVPSGWIVDGGGSLWVIDVNAMTGEYSGLITRIDPTTTKVIGTLQVPVAGTYPLASFAFGALWLKPADNDRLLKVDPNSGTTTVFEIPNFAPLTDFGDVLIAADSSSLWLRTSSKVVSQMDPSSGRVLNTYPAGPYSGGGYIAIGFGSLWVANFGMGSVWRDRIPG